MSNLLEKAFEGKRMRFTDIEGKKWACANDLASALGTRAADFIQSQWCDPKGVRSVPTPSAGGIQDTNFFDDRNAFAMIMRSDKPAALGLYDFVCREMLPAVTETGAYIHPDVTQEQLLPVLLAHPSAKALLQSARSLGSEETERKALSIMSDMQKDATRCERAVVRGKNKEIRTLKEKVKALESRPDTTEAVAGLVDELAKLREDKDLALQMAAIAKDKFNHMDAHFAEMVEEAAKLRTEATAPAPSIRENKPTSGHERQRVVRCLREILSDGPVQSKEIYRRLADRNMSKATIQRAISSAGDIRCTQITRGNPPQAEWWKFLEKHRALMQQIAFGQEP